MTAELMCSEQTRQSGSYPDRSSRPVFVGGVGGSGTRVIAALLQALGYRLGEDLNESLDNLWFTALFKRRAAWSAEDGELAQLYDVFRAATSGIPPRFPPDLQRLETAMVEPREQHSPSWLRQRLTSFFSRLAELQYYPLWAWKEPNSHIVADRILRLDPELRYIHVARNGLDIAFSNNQNQLRFWGDLAIPDVRSDCDSARSLSYWCWVERRAQRLQKEYPDRVLWIPFESLCRNPEKVAADLAPFLGRNGFEVAKQIERVFEPPSSIGRFRNFDKSFFRSEDIQFVKSLGFPVQ